MTDQPSRDQQRDRLVTIGSAFLGKVAQRLTTLNPDELSPADLARWTDVAAKLVQAGNHRPAYDRDARLTEQQLRPSSEEDEPIIQKIPRP
jgi:hypothetical protein